MDNIVEVISALPELLPIKAATDEQISDAESRLGVSFSKEYQEYLSSFGAIMADGIELSGIASSAHRNVVSLTEQAWKLNPKVPHTLYVVEDTHVDGIVVWQDAAGCVYQTAPDFAPKKIADSLKDYIARRTDR